MPRATCYDRFGNMTRKQMTNNLLVSTFAFTYTKAGKISSIVYPSGMVVNYSYNGIGQTTQVTVTQGGITTTLVDNLAYLPFGPLKQLSFPVPAGGTATSTLTQTRNYDTDYAVQSIGGLNYTQDVMGNITNISDAIGGNAFEYDNLDRLSKVKDSVSLADKTAFTYDATGNRLSKKVGTSAAQAYTYAATNHRLTNVAGVARTLDANGNTTVAATTKRFTYDARNRMVDFRTGSAASTIISQYQYNAKGERVRKYKGTVDQARYQYGEGGQLLVQNRIVGGVTTTQEIIWLGDMPIGVSQNGTLHGILTDHLNSPRGVFELATQKTVWRWNMADDAFGENLAVEDPDANGVAFKFDMRFPGQLFDSESGLHYNYQRDGYEPGSGRYTQSDPVGLPAGVSTYSYVNSSPTNRVDPYGLYDLGIRCGSTPYGYSCNGQPPVNSPFRKCRLSPKARKCMAKIFGVSEADVDGVNIEADSIFARAHFPQIKGHMMGLQFSFANGSTTRLGLIMTSHTCKSFGSMYSHMLHEYYHVFQQWGNDGMSLLGYVFTSSSKENAAEKFADVNLEAFNNCINGSCL